jgi:hypothetical protein
LKVDPTSATQHLTSKPEEIEYCYDYLSISSREFSPESLKLTTKRKASEVVNASLANKPVLRKCWL